MDDYYFGATVGQVVGISMTLIILLILEEISLQTFLILMAILNPMSVGLMVLSSDIKRK
jgi:ABC-type multidrug transport system permease subunit